MERGGVVSDQPLSIFQFMIFYLYLIFAKIINPIFISLIFDLISCFIKDLKTWEISFFMFGKAIEIDNF